MEKEEIKKINKIIEKLIDRNTPIYASRTIEENNFIKIRYEYLYYKKDVDQKIIGNVFIYLNDFNDLIKLYKLLPDEFKHFYEVIENKCKFFLDLDVKTQNMKTMEWNDNILIIKNELKLFFNKIFKKEINILEFRSMSSLNEPKYSCHLVIPDYCFDSEDCKIVCNMFLNELKDKKLNVGNIIDDKVYGYKRMLRIEGSTKINSKRIKMCLYDNINDKPNDIINLNGLITNLQNTTLLKLDEKYLIKNVFLPTENFENNNNNKYKFTINDRDKRYNYTENDILYLKNNFENIINIVNSWHYNKMDIKDDINDPIFNCMKIENNRMDLRRLKSFYCPLCKRLHEKQHSYIFISNEKIIFNCRRSDNSVKIN